MNCLFCEAGGFLKELAPQFAYNSSLSLSFQCTAFCTGMSCFHSVVQFSASMWLAVESFLKINALPFHLLLIFIFYDAKESNVSNIAFAMEIDQKLSSFVYKPMMDYSFCRLILPVILF